MLKQSQRFDRIIDINLEHSFIFLENKKSFLEKKVYFIKKWSYSNWVFRILKMRKKMFFYFLQHYIIFLKDCDYTSEKTIELKGRFQNNSFIYIFCNCMIYTMLFFQILLWNYEKAFSLFHYGIWILVYKHCILNKWNDEKGNILKKNSVCSSS